MIRFLVLMLLAVTVVGLACLIKPPANTTRKHILKIIFLYDGVILAIIFAVNAIYNLFGEAWGGEGQFFAAVILPLIALVIIKTNAKYRWLARVFEEFIVRIFVAGIIVWISLVQVLNAIFSLDYNLGDQEFINLNYMPPLLALMMFGLFRWVRGAWPTTSKGIGDDADRLAPATNPLAHAMQELNTDLTAAGATVTPAAPPATSKMRATFISARRKDKPRSDG